MSSSQDASSTSQPRPPDSPTGTFGTFGRKSSKSTLSKFDTVNTNQSGSSRDSGTQEAALPPPLPSKLARSSSARGKQRAVDDGNDSEEVIADAGFSTPFLDPSSSSLDPRTHWKGSLDRRTPSPLQHSSDDSEGQHPRRGETSSSSRAVAEEGSRSTEDDVPSGRRYGVGERGSYDVRGGTLERTRSPQSDLAQRERARLLEEDRQRETSTTPLPFNTTASSSRSPRLRPQPSPPATGDGRRTPRVSASTASRRRPLSNSSSGADTLRDIQERQARPLSLSDTSHRGRRQSSRSSRKHQSLTFSVPDNGSVADDESDRARRPRRSLGSGPEFGGPKAARHGSHRSRAHSAPTPGLGGAPMVRSHASMGRPSTTMEDDARRDVDEGWVSGGRPISLTFEEVALEQRRLSDAHAMAALAFQPRFSQMTPMTPARSRSILPRTVGEQEPEDETTATRRRSGRWFAVDRATLPLRVVLPIVITLFLDFNVLFIQGQLAVHADSDNSNVGATFSGRQSTAWWVSFAIYALCPLLSLFIFTAKMAQAYRLQSREEGVEARSAYLNDAGRLLLLLRSSSMHSLVRGVDSSASSAQGRLERTWRLRQAWPHALLGLPRIAILFVAVILYSPYQSGVVASPSTAMRDDFFFNQATGLLSTYGFAVTIVAIIWHGFGCLLVTVASLLVCVGERNTRPSSQKLRELQLVNGGGDQEQRHSRIKSSVSFPDPQLELGMLSQHATPRPSLSIKTGRAWQANTEDRLRLALLRTRERGPHQIRVDGTSSFSYELVDPRTLDATPAPEMRERYGSGVASSRLKCQDEAGLDTTSPTLLPATGDSRAQPLQPPKSLRGPLPALPPLPSPRGEGADAAVVPFPALEVPPRRSSSSFGRRESSETERAPAVSAPHDVQQIQPSTTTAQAFEDARRDSFRSMGTTGSGLWGGWFRPTAATRDSGLAVEGAMSPPLPPLPSSSNGEESSQGHDAQEIMANYARERQAVSNAAMTREVATGRGAPVVTMSSGQSRASMYGEVGEESPPHAPESSASGSGGGGGGGATDHSPSRRSDQPPHSRSSHAPSGQLAEAEGGGGGDRDAEYGETSLDTDETDPEEQRLWATFPEQSRRYPPGLIALEMQEKREREREEREREQQAATAAAASGASGTPGRPSSSEGLEGDEPTMTPSLSSSGDQLPLPSAQSMGWSRHPTSGSGLTAIVEESTSYAASSADHHNNNNNGGARSVSRASASQPSTRTRPTSSPQGSMPGSPTQSEGRL